MGHSCFKIMRTLPSRIPCCWKTFDYDQKDKGSEAGGRLAESLLWMGVARSFRDGSAVFACHGACGGRVVDCFGLALGWLPKRTLCCVLIENSIQSRSHFPFGGGPTCGYYFEWRWWRIIVRYLTWRVVGHTVWGSPCLMRHLYALYGIRAMPPHLRLHQELG